MNIERCYGQVPQEFGKMAVCREGEDNLFENPALWEEELGHLFPWDEVQRFIDIGDEYEPTLSVIVFKTGKVGIMFTHYGSMNVLSGYSMLGEDGWHHVKSHEDTLKYRY